MSQRRKSIIDAATRLFAAKGYEATPIIEVAAEAGISEGGLFRHFASKEALLIEIFRHVRERYFLYLEEHYRFRPEETGLDTALRLMTLYCRFYEDHEVDFDCIHRNNPLQMPGIGEPCRVEMQRIHDKMMDQLRFAVNLGVRDGSISPVGVEAGAYLLLSLLWGSVRMRLYSSIHLRELEALLVTFARRALSGDDDPVSAQKS